MKIVDMEKTNFLLVTLLSLDEHKNTKSYTSLLDDFINYFNTIENVKDIVDNKGQNFLMHCCLFSNLDLIKYFIYRNIDVHALDEESCNVFFFIDYGNEKAIDIVKLFLDKDVNIFHKNINNKNIFEYLNMIYSTTDDEKRKAVTGQTINFLIGWFSKVYLKKNIFTDDNLSTNTLSLISLDSTVIESVLEYTNYLTRIMDDLKKSILTLLKQYKEKGITVKINEDKSSIITIIKKNIQSEIGNELINAISLKVEDKTQYEKKLNNSIEVLNRMLNILKKQTVKLKIEESKILEEKALKNTEKLLLEEKMLEEEMRLLKIEQDKTKEKIKNKKNLKKIKQKEAENIKKELKLMEIEDNLSRKYAKNLKKSKEKLRKSEISLMEIEDNLSRKYEKDLREHLAHIEAIERSLMKEEDLLSGLLREEYKRVDKLAENKKERERLRKIREETKKSLSHLIHLTDSDFEDEVIYPEDPEILAELEKIYAEQKKHMFGEEERKTDAGVFQFLSI